MTTPRTVASLAFLFLIALRRSAPRRPIQHAALVSPLTRKAPMAYIASKLAKLESITTTPRTVASLAFLFLIALRRSAPRRPIQHAALVSPLTRKVPMAYIASKLATRESITTLTRTLASSAQPSIIAKQAR
jgi:hypothetical protein